MQGALEASFSEHWAISKAGPLAVSWVASPAQDAKAMQSTFADSQACRAVGRNLESSCHIHARSGEDNR